MKLITGAVLATAFLVPSATLWAHPQQDQQESLAAASRKALAAKKATTKEPKVFTNDDLDNLKGTVSVVGAAPVDESKPDDSNGAAPATTTKSEVKDEASWRKAFADARKTLADDQKELDVLQREYNLKEQQYYSDPNQALREQNDRKDLDDSKQAIDDKKAAVAKDTQAISDMEDQLRQSGGDPGWAQAQ